VTSGPIAAAIELHLQIAGELIAATRQADGLPILGNAEVIARLDLILAKLETAAVPLADQLWTLTEIAHYFRRHVVTVRESMACRPDFPAAISLPGRGGGRGKLLYRAGEIVEWAASYQEQR
jgi:hypothetical protein